MSFVEGPDLTAVTRRGLTRRQSIGAGAVGAAAVLAGSVSRASAAEGPAATYSEGFSAETKRILGLIATSGQGAASIPGLAVGVWVPGRGNYVAANGTGNQATGAPLTTSDHFRIASISKSFTATTVLRLVDQGRVKLTDKLESFVPGIENGKKVTVEQLLGMTSGIYDYVNDPELTVKETANPLLPFSLKDVIAITNSHSPAFPPGTDTMYNNGGYYLLGAIIEKVTRQPLHKVIKSQVLDPLGLHNTSYPTTPALPAPFAHGYFSQPNLGLRDVTASNPAFAGAAGAMISTLGDLKVWGRALAKGTLLKRATHLRQLQTRPLVKTPKINLSYGLGITEVNGFLGHDGAIVGYGSQLLYLPKHDATIIVLGNNNDNGSPAPLFIGLALAAYLFPGQFPNGL